MYDLLITDVLMGGAGRVDVAIQEGRFAAIEPAGTLADDGAGGD